MIVAAGPGVSATAWVARLSDVGAAALIAGVVLLGVLAAAGAFALSLLRQHGRLLLRVDRLEEALASHGIAVPDLEDPVAQPAGGLALGAAAPEFQLLDVRHRKTSLTALSDDHRPLMLVFTDPGCGPCLALMPRVGAWQREHSDELRIALISRGERDANLAHAREHGLDDVLIQHDREVNERYEVNGTPSAVLVSPDAHDRQPAARGCRCDRGACREPGRHSVAGCAPARPDDRTRGPGAHAAHTGRRGADAVEHAGRPDDGSLLAPVLRLLRADDPGHQGIRARAARRRAEPAADLHRRSREQSRDGPRGTDPARRLVRGGSGVRRRAARRRRCSSTARDGSPPEWQLARPRCFR